MPRLLSDATAQKVHQNNAVDMSAECSKLEQDRLNKWTNTDAHSFVTKIIHQKAVSISAVFAKLLGNICHPPRDPPKPFNLSAVEKLQKKVSVHCKLARKLNWVRNRNFFHFEVSFKLNYREVYCQLLVIDKRENLTFRAFQSMRKRRLHCQACLPGDGNVCWLFRFQSLPSFESTEHHRLGRETFISFLFLRPTHSLPIDARAS